MSFYFEEVYLLYDLIQYINYFNQRFFKMISSFEIEYIDDLQIMDFIVKYKQKYTYYCHTSIS